MLCMFDFISVFFLLVVFFLLEQNEAKYESSSSPGMTDQEKEVAASAYEAFLVIHLFSILIYSESQSNIFVWSESTVKPSHPFKLLCPQPVH